MPAFGKNNKSDGLFYLFHLLITILIPCKAIKYFHSKDLLFPFVQYLLLLYTEVSIISESAKKNLVIRIYWPLGVDFWVNSEI